ncbi:MAG: ABC transporter permease [Bdellovibrionales bacterium]
MSAMKYRSRSQFLFQSLASFWLVILVLIPLVYVLVLSFLTKGTYGGVVWAPSLTSYGKLLDPEYASLFSLVFLRSFLLAGITTVLCLLVGYPFALFLVFRAGRWKALFFVLLVIPFWTNFLIRTYAWFALLSDNGWLITLARWFSPDLESLGILFTPTAVYLGMLYNYLPFMAMTLYLNLEKIDGRLLEAAHDLGAGRYITFLKVLLPLSYPGIVAGSILVFIPALGEFVIPDILGGGREVYIGNLLTQQFLTSRNWPLGSAVSVILLVLILGIMWGLQKYQKSKNVELIL